MHLRASNSVLDGMRLLAPLALVDAVQEVDPVVDGGGCRVEMDSVDEGGWCGVDSFPSGVLPDLTDLPGGVVGVLRAIDGLDVCFLEPELGSNLGGPPWDEVILRGGLHA